MSDLVYTVTAEDGSRWELVVGLEVHCELATATKLFCGCPNQFGEDPNTNICPVCLGLPGSLPVLNRQAVELAMRIGRALGCSVEPSVFARKNYFYPDMPKDYQTSQYDRPINVDGELALPDGTAVGIERAHLEEDTGKNTHAGGGGRIHDSDYSLIDYNRAGVPLVEIVSRPDLRTPEQARAYVTELRHILVAIDASDARMEEGSMRVDANVSVRPVGSTELGTRCEIKNLNSIRSLGRAIEYEARRQVDLVTSGERVHQETRHWDEAGGRTRPGRSKEEAEDYRYFDEPDLVPVEPEQAWREAVDAALPALPAARRERLAELVGLAPTDDGVALTVERDLDELAVAAIEAGGDPGRVLTHVEHNLDLATATELVPGLLAALVAMEVDGALTATQAKQVLAEVQASGRAPAEVAAELGFEAMDTSELEAVLDEIIAANPDEWDGFVNGDDKRRGKLTGFFTGQVMRATKGQADGKVVNQLLTARRNAASSGE